ncbi:DNA translocase FtsK [Sulfurimonas sp.]|uniref:DNA translocase FtsK n=1 Tax=Sulfurimonas sp. TaxID=2022749 RepID=UPI002B493CD4|nr:DNA translocase FtsK [Sulfurimonas sp.]
MKETIFIATFGIIIYLSFATIFGHSGLIGSYGVAFSTYNHLYFGYVSFVYLLLFLLPLYFLYKNPSFNIRKFELGIASFLILFSFLLAQSMLVQNEFRGKIGADFTDFLSPYIGLLGLWIFWFIITSVSVLLLANKSMKELASILKVKVKKEKSIDNIIEENNTSSEYDEPAYLRQNENKKLIQAQEKEQVMEVKKVSKEKHTNTILDIALKVKEQKNALIVDELEENTKLLESIEKGKVEKPKNFTLPSVDFLQKADITKHNIDESELDDKIRYLIEKLAHFKIDGDVVRTYAGPVVSTFEFKPAANVKVSKILNLQDDLAMALSAETIRIQAPIPGKDVVGIEIPNDSVDTIYLRDLLDSKLFKDSSSPLTIALGKDIVGKPFVTDLKKLPHLLIAGTTGSGKSVGINAMILSLLYKNSPDQLRLLMIDPKMLEFSIYNDIPHLLTPVITKPKQAIVALNNMVSEMERRYEMMAETRTKNIENYNEKAKKEGGESFPYIVVIIDELADLMMTSGKEVEHSIARLAQMARASGIHLVVATQRPSVDVVTGLIKANLPSRISYRVGQKVDSKIILDQMGAESLLGRGDMLFTPPGSTGLVRLHAPWSTEKEIEDIVEFIKSQREPSYDKSFLLEDTLETSEFKSESYEELDSLYNEAKHVILTDRKTSISYLQRKLQIGYNRSARIIEQLEGEGILSTTNAKGVREIL